MSRSMGVEERGAPAKDGVRLGLGDRCAPVVLMAVEAKGILRASTPK